MRLIAAIVAIALILLPAYVVRRLARWQAARREQRRVEDARLAAWVEAQKREDAAWVNLPCGYCGGSTQPPGMRVVRRAR